MWVAADGRTTLSLSEEPLPPGVEIELLFRSLLRPDLQAPVRDGLLSGLSVSALELVTLPAGPALRVVHEAYVPETTIEFIVPLDTTMLRLSLTGASADRAELEAMADRIAGTLGVAGEAMP